MVGGEEIPLADCHTLGKEILEVKYPWGFYSDQLRGVLFLFRFCKRFNLYPFYGWDE